MQATSTPIDARRYAKTIEASKRVRWDIDRDVIRGRRSTCAKKFLPDGLSLVDEIDGLSADKRRFLARCRAAPTPTCSAWSSASSARRCSRSAVTIGSATRPRWRRSSASPTRS